MWCTGPAKESRGKLERYIFDSEMCIRNQGSMSLDWSADQVERTLQTNAQYCFRFFFVFAF